jgi:hypothetical protein
MENQIARLTHQQAPPLLIEQFHSRLEAIEGKIKQQNQQVVVLKDSDEEQKVLFREVTSVLFSSSSSSPFDCSYLFPCFISSLSSCGFFSNLCVMVRSRLNRCCVDCHVGGVRTDCV